MVKERKQKKKKKGNVNVVYEENKNINKVSLTY